RLKGFRHCYGQPPEVRRAFEEAMGIGGSERIVSSEIVSSKWRAVPSSFFTTHYFTTHYSLLPIEQRRCLPRDLGRDRVELLQQVLDAFGGHRIDLELGPLCFRQKLAVAEGVHECLAQRRGAIRRHVRRTKVGTADHLPGDQEAEDASRLLVLGELHQ